MRTAAKKRPGKRVSDYDNVMPGRRFDNDRNGEISGMDEYFSLELFIGSVIFGKTIRVRFSKGLPKHAIRRAKTLNMSAN